MISWPRICGAVAVVIFLFAISECAVSYIQDARAVVERGSRP